MTSFATALADDIDEFNSTGLLAENLWNASSIPILATDLVALFVHMGNVASAIAVSSTTRIPDPWITVAHSGTTMNGQMRRQLLISDLGWSAEEAAEIRLRLLPFEDDWDAPEMDVYNAL